LLEVGSLAFRSVNQTFPHLSPLVEDCRRAVWAPHAGFHTGGHPFAWDEDLGHHHCTPSFSDKFGFDWALDCCNDTRKGEETSSVTEEHLAEKQTDVRKNLLFWGWEEACIRRSWCSAAGRAGVLVM